VEALAALLVGAPRRASWLGFHHDDIMLVKCPLLFARLSVSVILALCRWTQQDRSVSAAWLDAAAGQTINSV